MHPAPIFRSTDTADLVARIRAHPLGIITVNGPQAPLATHTPVLISDDGTELRFHLSRASALNPLLAEHGHARIVLTGPSAYISPDWYGLEDQVPTWNYLSAEVAGPVTVMDAAGATALLDDLSAVFEARLLPKPPWTRHKMTAGVFERMLNGITAYTMKVEQLTGTTKLSQNKPEAAHIGVREGLGPDHPISQAMGALKP